MPAVELVLYREGDVVPLLDWLAVIPLRARIACLRQIERLRGEGHALRRPAADYLVHGVYELRARTGRVRYRILYFFHGAGRVVLTHGFTKQRSAVPEREIWKAVTRKRRYEANPAAHSFRVEGGDLGA